MYTSIARCPSVLMEPSVYAALPLPSEDVFAFFPASLFANQAGSFHFSFIFFQFSSLIYKFFSFVAQVSQGTLQSSPTLKSKDMSDRIIMLWRPLVIALHI